MCAAIRIGVDAVNSLAENTGKGFLSSITYDKQDGSAPSERLIEPKWLVRGSDSLLVLCYQHEPVFAVRNFCTTKITQVRRSEKTLTKRHNRFNSGEVLQWTGDIDERIETRSPTADPQFTELVSVVREIVSDNRITSDERELLTRAVRRLEMTEKNVDAAMAFVLGEFLLSITRDGVITQDESIAARDMQSALKRLGRG